MKKTEFFKVEGNRINRIRRHCPKCGPGVFLADHKDRFGCGKCGYTEFKSGGGKEPIKPPVEEKTVTTNNIETNEKTKPEITDDKNTKKEIDEPKEEK